MAPFTNELGEISPDETVVKITVDGTTSTGTITKIEVANSKTRALKPVELLNIPAVLNKGFITPFKEESNYVSPVIDVQPANFDTVTNIQRIPHEVVYMDVGRWGGATKLAGRQRNFGLAWGTTVALCDFEPKTPALDNDANLLVDENGVPRIDHPINDFIRQLRTAGGSVRMLRAMLSGNPNFLNGWKQDFQTLYVILPDLHLPVSTKKPSPPDGLHMGRHLYKEGFTTLTPADEQGMIGSGNSRRFGPGADRWFDQYLAGDIFGGPDSAAAKDLDQFLGIIEGIKLPNGRTLHFVQVGDMYDMWIGLGRFFSAQPTQTVLLRNGVGDNTGILAGTFIDTWADRTHLALQSAGGTNVVNRMNQLAGKMKTSWLWGNHDNYLSAHTPVVSVGSAVLKRQREVREGGILIEHGQRGDPDNRDGAIIGHIITNGVFDHAFGRALDPNRRAFFTALAGATYVNKPDFHLFVMGHTHSPFLSRLRIEVVVATKKK